MQRYNFIDETGKRFGKLRVVERQRGVSPQGVRWICRCLCGVETVTRGTALRNGTTKSCGCGKSPQPTAYHKSRKPGFGIGPSAFSFEVRYAK